MHGTRAGYPGTPGTAWQFLALLASTAAPFCPKSMKHTKWTPRNETRHYRPVSDRHWMERPSALQSRVGLSRSSDSYTSVRYCVGGKQIIICFIITALSHHWFSPCLPTWNLRTSIAWRKETHKRTRRHMGNVEVQDQQPDSANPNTRSG